MFIPPTQPSGSIRPGAPVPLRHCWRHPIRGQQHRHSEQGVTLIEGLIAIIIVTLTVVAVTPPIFLATATRVQSRRAQQANQIAQSEVDRVRTLMERGALLAELPAVGGTGIKDVGVASGIKAGLMQSEATCGNYPATPAGATELVPVDVNGDCIADFVMQVFRSGDAAATTVPANFDLGVRVYRFVPGQTLPALSKDQIASQVIGSGPRDDGGGRRRPLAMVYTTLLRPGDSDTLDAIR